MSVIIAYESRGHTLAKHLTMAAMRAECLREAGHPAVTLVIALEGIIVCATNGNAELVPWQRIAETDGEALDIAITAKAVIRRRGGDIPEGHVIDDFGRARKARTSDDMNVLALLSVLRLTFESLEAAGQGPLVRQILGDDYPEDDLPAAPQARPS